LDLTKTPANISAFSSESTTLVKTFLFDFTRSEIYFSKKRNNSVPDATNANGFRH